MIDQRVSSDCLLEDVNCGVTDNKGLTKYVLYLQLISLFTSLIAQDVAGGLYFSLRRGLVLFMYLHLFDIEKGILDSRVPFSISNGRRFQSDFQKNRRPFDIESGSR